MNPKAAASFIMFPLVSLILAISFLAVGIPNIGSPLIIGIVFSIIPIAFAGIKIKILGMVLFLISFTLLSFEHTNERDRAFMKGRESALHKK